MADVSHRNSSNVMLIARRGILGRERSKNIPPLLQYHSLHSCVELLSGAGEWAAGGCSRDRSCWLVKMVSRKSRGMYVKQEASACACAVLAICGVVILCRAARSAYLEAGSARWRRMRSVAG